MRISSRNVLAGRGLTRVPRRPAVSTTPRWRSSRYAAAAVPGLTPARSATSRTGGSTAPGGSRPSDTATSTPDAISLAVPPVNGYVSSTMLSMY